MSELRSICTKVLVADDHGIVRHGLRRILEDEEDMTVVGEAENGWTCVQSAESLHPDVIIMDITMPLLNGTEATRMIHERCPEIAIIILSMHSTAEYVFRALKAGASGYLLKESVGQEIIEAIRVVQSGKRYFSPKVSDVLIDDYLTHRQSTEGESLLDRLSEREREVFQLVVEGKPSKEIANIINLSPKTVETYRSRIMQKLSVNNITELVRFAVEHGIVSSP